LTVVRKYPTNVFSNIGGWTNSNNALNIEDGVCASKGSLSPGYYACYVDTYGFNIPSNATINKVTVAIKSAMTAYIDDDVFFWWTYGLTTIAAYNIVYGVCADSGYRTNSLSPPSTMPTPAQINGIAGNSGDSYTFFGWEHNDFGLANGYVDSMYIEIDYIVPSAVMLRRLLVGQGLMMKNKNVMKHLLGLSKLEVRKNCIL
jgi:hypothetical protein